MLLRLRPHGHATPFAPAGGARVSYARPVRCILSHPVLLLTICLACVTPPKDTSTGDGKSESDTEGDGDGDGDGDTDTETGDGPCEAGLTMCCPNGEPECEDVYDEFRQTEGCIDVASNSYHCGGCDMVCPSNGLDIVNFPAQPTPCIDSVCMPTVGACVFLDMYPNCDLACAVSNRTCVQQGCFGHTMFIFGVVFPGNPMCNPDTGNPYELDIACDASPPPEYFGVESSVTCCCE